MTNSTNTLVKLNAILEAAQANVDITGMKAAQCGRALVGRINQGKRLEQDIRVCKRSRRVLSQAGLSTQSACRQLIVNREAVKTTWEVVAHLKAHYKLACDASYTAKNTLEVIKAAVEAEEGKA